MKQKTFFMVFARLSFDAKMKNSTQFFLTKVTKNDLVFHMNFSFMQKNNVQNCIKSEQIKLVEVITCLGGQFGINYPGGFLKTLKLPK